MLWQTNHPLLLASQSLSRRMLLENAGIAIDICPAKIDERAIEIQSGLELPGAIAEHLAQAKALAVSAHHPDRIVLGADQTLALGSRRFSKPADRIAAARQLRALSGATHELHSAIALARGGKVLYSHVSVARMTMRALSDSFIETYLAAAGEKVCTSVGAYQLEGPGVHLFDRIEGDHFTILGLPLLPLLEFFRTQGWVAA